MMILHELNRAASISVGFAWVGIVIESGSSRTCCGIGGISGLTVELVWSLLSIEEFKFELEAESC